MAEGEPSLEECNWINASKKSLNNSRHLLDDADILASRKRFGTSTALTILAEEEQAKALLLLGYHWGLRKPTQRDIASLKQHRWKQNMLGIVSYVEMKLLPTITMMLQGREDPSTSEDVAVSRIGNLLGDLIDGEAISLLVDVSRDSKAIQELMSNVKSRERNMQLKNSCLYVDVSLQGEASIQDPDLEDYRRIREIAHRNQASYESLLGVISKYPEFDKTIRAACQRYKKKTRSVKFGAGS